jgi:serine/threonine protein kinase
MTSTKKTDTAAQEEVAVMKPREKRVFALENFELKETLGTGTFGRVRLTNCNIDNKHYALKMLKKVDILRLKQVDHIKSEVRILSMIEHPFIVNMAGHFQNDQALFMVIEYVQGGELYSHLRREVRFSDEKSKFYATEIVLAFSYLHGLKVIYRDLKPENLLITAAGHVKITDFGFAKVVEDRTWTLCGTPEYLAPEIIQSKGHGKSVDWWALGVLIYEMLAGYPPFYDESPFGIYQKILAGRVEYPRHIDPKAKDCIKKLLAQDRTKRLGCIKGGAVSVKNHKWFAKLDWNAAFQCAIEPPFKPEIAGDADTTHFDDYPDSEETVNPEISDHDKAQFDEFDTF